MKALILLSFAFLLLAGCGQHLPRPSQPAGYAADDRLILTSHAAVEQLLAAIPPTKRVDKRQPIIIASLVNVDDLTSSRLGRAISEQLGTVLSRDGYTVIELKLRGSIFIRQGAGELLLSRELKEISQKHQAQAVLIGTYAQALSDIYVNLKLVGADDSQVIAAHDYVLPLDGNVRSLLWSRSP